MSDTPNVIARREAIRRVGAIIGGTAILGNTTLLAACTRADEEARRSASQGIGSFTAADVALLDEVADTILPETGTPGAKAALVGPFIAMMVTDTYDERDQGVFRDGLAKLETKTRELHQQPFVDCTPQQRTAVLQVIDREAYDYSERLEALKKTTPPAGSGSDKAAESGMDTTATGLTSDSPRHYFRMIKDLTLLGYFTSEIGYTQAMRYTETPGRFDPCVPYTQGEVSWAPHA